MSARSAAKSTEVAVPSNLMPKLKAAVRAGQHRSHAATVRRLVKQALEHGTDPVPAPIGKAMRPLRVQLEATALSQVDTLATQHGVSRSAMLLALVAAELDRP